ncbi:hypothetical protein GF407_14035 [candidate division KSB1 bacterium]|nr:hypothetical protein [candidate division KSB1 bacterium]
MERGRDMQLPFTLEQFFDVIAQYNQSIWPAQIFLNILAVAAVILVLFKVKSNEKMINGILGAFWLWIGIVYHLAFFTDINQGAYLFGFLFIVQGIIFVFAGVIKDKLLFHFEWDMYNLFGIVFILYALILYPIIGHQMGHIYPEQPTFGLPCPTTIFTFGILLWTSSRIPKYVLVIPLLWSLIGLSAAINLTIKEDYGLLIAGLVGTTLILIRDRRRS